ncbi:MAG: class I SAM-dependent methyltransferase [Verrucomicrobiota bacterium]|jgi:cephalosporin hydroxylase
MPTIDWKSETEFALEGVNFKCILSDYAKYETSSEEVILIKDKHSIDLYQEIFEKTPPARVLEFGTYQGGSPVLLMLMFNLQKYVGIDLRPPISGVQEFLDKHPVGRRVSIHYNVSQDNGEAIRSIVASEFGDNPIDLIIDDASHQYELSRRTFEIAFPLLRPGGIYVLEDWGWAHWPHFEQWQDAPALSNLVFQLTALCAAHSELIQDMRIFPVFLFIKKSGSPSPKTELTLDSLIGTRAERLNLI